MLSSHRPQPAYKMRSHIDMRQQLAFGTTMRLPDCLVVKQAMDNNLFREIACCSSAILQV